MLHADGYRTLADLTVTPRAASFMRQLLLASRCRGEVGLRLAVRSQGWAGLSGTLTPERAARADEQTWRLPGLCLFLDRESARLLEGVLIDCEERHGRTQLCFLDRNLGEDTQPVRPAYTHEQTHP